MIAAQREDESLAAMMEQAQTQRDVEPTTTYFLKEGVLFRRWLPPTFQQKNAEWASVEQLVVPTKYRQGLLDVAHDGQFAGHMGVRKTVEKLTRLYFWPGITANVARHCK